MFFRPGKGKRLHYASFDRNSGLDLPAIRRALLCAQQNGEVLLLHGHSPCRPQSSIGYFLDITLLEAILGVANELGLKYYTMNRIAG